MKTDTIFSNGLFLAVTFLPAIYLAEYAVADKIHLSLCMIVAAIIILALEYKFGKEFKKQWRLWLFDDSQKRWKKSLALLIVLAPQFLLFYFFFTILTNTNEELISYVVFLCFATTHIAMFMVLRVFIDTFVKRYEKLTSLVEYSAVLAMSIPLVSIALFFHFAWMYTGLVTVELFLQSFLYFLVSSALALVFTAYTIYFVPKEVPIQEKDVQSFLYNPALHEAELNRIHKYLEVKRS